MLFFEPLLYRNVSRHPSLRKQAFPDKGQRAVRTDDIFGGYFVLDPILRIGDPIDIIDFLNTRAKRTLFYLDVVRDKRYQPPVELMSVKVDVKPLIIPQEVLFGVNRSHRKDLWIDKHFLGQCQVESRQGFLRIRCQQTATGLSKRVARA